MAAVDGLNPSDPGIALLGESALDLEYGVAHGGRDALLVHCGDVPRIGDAATRLVLDVRELESARHRCVPADVASVAGALDRNDFGVALLWPRAHLGIDFSEACIATAVQRVKPGGTVLLTARKQKGGKRLASTLQRLTGDLRVHERRSGYAVYAASRGDDYDRELADEITDRAYLIEDELLGELALVSRPGVFSRKQLDGGTRCLLEHVLRADAEGRIESPRKVIDLCCGIGPLGLRAALDWPKAEIYAIDSNFVASSLVEHNAAAAELTDRVKVRCHDGMPEPGENDFADLALVNPPTHADKDTLEAILSGLWPWLGPGRKALIVVNRPGRTIEVLKARGATGEMYEYDGYVVVEAWQG